MLQCEVPANLFDRVTKRSPLPSELSLRCTANTHVLNARRTATFRIECPTCGRHGATRVTFKLRVLKKSSQRKVAVS
jgi:4-hydroxy-3-methylbut-2-en-1-yl diphosphate synthase IspG/GcpE